MHAALAPHFFRSAPRAPYEWQRVLASPDATVLVNEEEAAAGAQGGTITGAISLRVYDTPADPRMVPTRRAHVDALVVAEGARRRGIGRALMDAAAAWGRQRGATLVVLTVWGGNSAARAFYRSLGYDFRSEVLDRKL